jgi:RNA polymerase II-associated factor 1
MSSSSKAAHSSATGGGGAGAAATTGHDKSRAQASEFLCKIRYLNTLPDLPFEPKLLDFSFDDTRFIRYQPTSLEKNFKPALHLEPDFNLAVDLIDQTQHLAAAAATTTHGN